MKNGIVLILALILSLSLAACDKRTSDAPGATTTPTAPASSASVVSSETTAPTMTTAPASSTSVVPSKTTAPTMTTVPAPSTSVVPSETTVPPKPTTSASSTNTTPSKTTVPTATTVPASSTNVVSSKSTRPTHPIIVPPWVTTVPTKAPTTVPTATTVPTSLTNTVPGETRLPTDPTDETIPKAPKLEGFRVVGKKEDGIILHIGYTDGLEEIYAYVKTDLKAKAFDTVYMEYYEGDIKKQNGKFMYEIGRPEEREYTYVLENVVNIRFPVAGEATYG